MSYSLLLLSQETNIVSRDIYSTSRDDFWQDFLRLIYAALLPQHIAAASLTADNWRGTRPQCGFLFPAAPDAIAYGMCVLEFVLVAMLSTEETRKYGFEGCAGPPPPSYRLCRAVGAPPPPPVQVRGGGGGARAHCSGSARCILYHMK